jgi:DNA polymerase-1
MMMTTHPKVPTKKRRSIWSFGSGVSDESSEENHHKYYKTPGHWTFLSDYSRWFRTEVIITKLSKLCLFWYWNYGLDALHAELVGISFSYEKGKDFTYPSGESGWSKALAEKFMPFSKTKNRENWTEFEIWFKNTVELRHKCRRELFDTMIAHYLINPDMRHNMDILAETYLKYSQNLLKN